MARERAGRQTGRLILVGAGPGDPDLITVRGAAALGRADVVLYDELASEELLSHAGENALLVNVGKRGHDHPTRGQDDINRLIVEHALKGRTVVRLKGGDPFVFGRGAEEATACTDAGIPYEVVPGITSALAVPAYAGIPITDRRFSASFAVVTGHKDPTRVAKETRWRDLARAVDTLVILMGMRNLPKLVAELIDSGRPASTPAAAIMQGTLPEQRVVVSDLETLAQEVASAGLGAPSVVVVGDVVSLREQLGWWENAPLFGMRALVTRAPHQARELASPLRAAGAVPVIVPLIDLRQNQDPVVLVEIERALSAIDAYDDVVFSSTNSVRFFKQHAERLGLEGAVRDLRARVLCIGVRTAREALDAGLPVHFVATGGRDAETMLREIVATLPPAGRRVLIPRSDIGRDVLVQGLRDAGAEVDAISFYCNRPPEVDAATLRSDLVAGRLPILTFTSPSTVEHFARLLDGPARAACSRSIIGAIGNTTARALREAGLEPDVIPERPGMRDMVEAISAHVASLRDAIEGQEDET